MDLYPAIDLRGGRCVRLYQGDFDRETAYGADPVSVAEGYLAAGARWVHVVDLDAARTGVAHNLDTVAAISRAASPSMAVQSGGGVRDRRSFETLRAAGVTRVVMGTAALADPALVAELASEAPVAVGLDGRDGALAVRGWTEPGGGALLDAVRRFEQAGVAALIVTEIERDGTLAGPDLEGLAGVLEATAIDVVASGGVGSLADLDALASLSAGGRRLSGVIVGKALYEGVFTVEEALAACAASG